DALARFVVWSHDHPSARCPDAVALGLPALDPWGHPLRITCTDQPADQIAGIVSAGPDGIVGTRDDVESWTLGADVVDIIRGPRWGASHNGSRRTGGTHGARHELPAAATSSKPPASPGAGSNDSDGDGIPNRR